MNKLNIYFVAFITYVPSLFSVYSRFALGLRCSINLLFRRLARVYSLPIDFVTLITNIEYKMFYHDKS